MLSLRELLKATLNDVKVDPENDSLVCISANGEKRHIPSPVVKNGKVYSRKKVGRGKVTEKGALIGGEGHTWEEYEWYEDILVPVFNADFVPLSDRKLVGNDINKIIQYADDHPDTILRYGDNPGGKKVVWLSILEAEKRVRLLQEQYDNIHIEVRHSCGNLLFNGRHYVLSCKVPPAVWKRIKHCFRFTDTRKLNDEVWGEAFVGYEILPDKIQEVEDLLEIPEHLRFAQLQEDARKLEDELKHAKREKRQFIEEIEKEFSRNNSIPDGIPEGEKIRLEGEEIPFRGMHLTPYGGGEWFVVQPDAIWRVINNGGDGDDWSLNNIRTGGAGAIGMKFEITPRRMELLDRLKNCPLD